MGCNKEERHYPLALIVPTHYTKPLNYASICQSLHVAQVYPEQIQLVISDNSQDQEKFDFLKKISSGMNNVKLIHGPLEKNHLCALNAANCDYVLFAPDDDIVIHPALGDIIDLLLAHPQSIGFAGSYARQTSNGCELNFFPGLDSPAINNRIDALLSSFPKGNPIFHTILKKKTVLDGMDFMFNCPNLQFWHDQILSLFFVLAGPFVNIEKNYFIYNFTHWEGVAKRIDREIFGLEYYQLPISLVLIQRLMLALEGYHLILNSTGSKESAMKWFDKWYTSWKFHLPAYFNNEKIESCSFYLDVKDIVEFFNQHQAPDISRLFEKICFLYEKINSTGTCYRNYWSV